MNRLLEQNERIDETKKVREEDKLFATLDTTVRKIEPKGKRAILLSDTVGFINELPHSLVKAFRSTLEEVRYADLLLQVVDFSDEHYRDCMRVTDETLKEIGAAAIPMLYVFNKADKAVGTVFRIPAVRQDSIYMSALQGEGVKELLDLIEEKLREGTEICCFLFPYSEGKYLNHLQETEEILETEYRENGTWVKVRCKRETAQRYRDYSTQDTET